MKTLYVTDLDGTLLNNHAELTPASVAMLNEAISKGALFSVATARTPATVSRLLKDVNINLPLIVMTGAALWNPASNEYQHIKRIPEADTARLISLYKEYGVSSFIYSLQPDGIIHICHTGKMSEHERQFISDRLDSPFKTFEIPEDGNTVFNSENDIPHAVLFFAQQPDELMRPLYERLQKENICKPVYYFDNYGSGDALMEVFSPQTNKAAAVETLRKLTGADRVVAFGDNVNDIPNFEAADVAVAVENAIPQVREKADIIIGNNDQDAVARFILEDLKCR